jgi:hypothetical protein
MRNLTAVAIAIGLAATPAVAQTGPSTVYPPASSGAKGSPKATPPEATGRRANETAGAATPRPGLGEEARKNAKDLNASSIGGDAPPSGSGGGGAGGKNP